MVWATAITCVAPMLPWNLQCDSYVHHGCGRLCVLGGTNSHNDVYARWWTECVTGWKLGVSVCFTWQKVCLYTCIVCLQIWWQYSRNAPDCTCWYIHLWWVFGFVKIQVDRNLSKALFLLLRGHGRDIQSSQKHSLIENVSRTDNWFISCRWIASAL